MQRVSEGEVLFSFATTQHAMSLERLSSSNLLIELVQSISVGSSEALHVPEGYLDAWAGFIQNQLSSSSDAASTIKLLKVRTQYTFESD